MFLLGTEEEYKGTLRKITKFRVQCKNCNFEWKRNYRFCRGCPSCNSSKNEKITLKILNNFGFESSTKTIAIKIDGLHFCVVDAAFNYKNKQIFIEYNGIQHYEKTVFGGKNHEEEAEKNFIRQQKRDEWLRHYCQENNIILIEIDGRKYKGYKIKPFLLDQLLVKNIIPPSWKIAGLAD